MFFFVEPKNYISFSEKSIINILLKIQVNFSVCNTEETKALIIPYKKAHIHDTRRNFQEKKKTGKVRSILYLYGLG